MWLQMSGVISQSINFKCQIKFPFVQIVVSIEFTQLHGSWKVVGIFRWHRPWDTQIRPRQYDFIQNRCIKWKKQLFFSKHFLPVCIWRRCQRLLALVDSCWKLKVFYKMQLFLCSFLIYKRQPILWAFQPTKN